MRLEIGNDFPDVLIELNDLGRYEVSFGDFDEGTDEDWTPILCDFCYKSDALTWAYTKFKSAKHKGMFVVLDNSKELELLAFSEFELELIKKLIEEEHANGN